MRTGSPIFTLLWSAVTAALFATTTTDAFGGFVCRRRPWELPRSNQRIQFQAQLLGHVLAGPQSLTPTGNLSQTAEALLSIPLIDISMILAYLWIWAASPWS